MKPMMNNSLINYLVYTNGGNKKNPYGDIMRITTGMKMTVVVVIVIKANTTQRIIKWVLVTCKNYNFRNNNNMFLFA